MPARFLAGRSQTMSAQRFLSATNRVYSSSHASFDHLVGEDKHLHWHIYLEGICGFAVQASSVWPRGNAHEISLADRLTASGLQRTMVRLHVTSG